MIERTLVVWPARLIERLLAAASRPLLTSRCLRTGESWFWYYRGSVHWWNLRLFVGDLSEPWPP